ncbi:MULTISPECIES: hypothetical protein [unclassified Myroides]|uniref:hypothetical protein n=1 Tax=unclassified Myroides TaxID=2642485 RepID=UPI003D2F8F4D
MNAQDKSYKTELEKLYSSQNFKEGKSYFQFGNFDYRFKFINENERKSYDLSNTDEYLVAISLSYDLDDHFHLVFNEKQDAYYIRNGSSSSTPQSVGGEKRFLKPIKVGKTLSEIFGCENFYDLLIDLNDQEYHLYCERQFYGGIERVNDEIPKAFVPNEDLRLYIQRTNPDCYLTSHEEYNIKNFTAYVDKKSIKEYFDIDSFFSKKLHPKHFIEVLNKINHDLGRQRFFFVEFFPSGWYAIVDTDEIPKTLLADYLKYGLIYNKIDIPEETYELLK